MWLEQEGQTSPSFCQCDSRIAGTYMKDEIGLGKRCQSSRWMESLTHEKIPATALSMTMNHFSPDEKAEYGRPPDALVRFVCACLISGNGVVGTVDSLFPGGREEVWTISRCSSDSTCKAVSSVGASAIV